MSDAFVIACGGTPPEDAETLPEKCPKCGAQTMHGFGLMGGGSASYVLTTGVRRFTPREAERLQGFPDDYTALPGAKDSPRYAALGNSMAVPVMRWIGERIARVDAAIRGAA